MKMLLVEIGTEELPPPFVKDGMQQFLHLVEGFLKENRISFNDAKGFATPRRIAVLFQGVSEKQEDTEKTIIGPPKEKAYRDGKPTDALLGFAKSIGAKREELEVISTKRGEYIGISRREKGRDTKSLLEESLPAIISQIKFPKTMRWCDSFRFARPIRWILALFGDEILNFEIADVKSSNTSMGHILLSRKFFRLDKPSLYIETLKKHSVIVDREERKKLIDTLMKEKVKDIDGVIVEDTELLDEVTDMTECPAVIIGRFDKKYLRLPAPVIVAALKEHQRYFSIRDKNGDLLPYFAAVINTKEEFKGEILPGMEQVLRAKLEDADFYFTRDMERKFEERIEDLKGILWKEGLGTMHDKVERIVNLALYLSKEDREVDHKLIEKGAKLSKLDLTTEMIRDGKEFTKLEGIIGMEYALRQGIDRPLAQIIYEHTLPRFPGDVSPTMKESAYIGIADRLDSIAGLVSSGYELTGSQDPMGVRRLTYGIIEILLDLDIRIDIQEAIKKALEPFNGSEMYIELIKDFVLKRFEAYLEDGMGVRYDIVDAVIASGIADLVNIKLRALKLKELLDRDKNSFDRLVIGQKRVFNIVKDVKDIREVEEQLFEKEEEHKLWEKAKEIEPLVSSSIEKEDFSTTLRYLLELREPIDRLFDNVFVMVDDERLRNNRLSLLHYVRSIFTKYGDLSLIIVEGGQQNG